jgi:hypothetical protein
MVGVKVILPWMMINMSQAQTPQQRRANERFAKTEAAKRGKAPTIKPKKNTKSPLSASWVGMYLTHVKSNHAKASSVTRFCCLRRSSPRAPTNCSRTLVHCGLMVHPDHRITWTSMIPLLRQYPTTF